MAGEKAEKLVAAVREVQEAQTLSGNAYPMFAAMGFKMQYQVMRRGLRRVLRPRAQHQASAQAQRGRPRVACRYTILVGTQVVELSLMVLEGQGEDGQPAVVVPGLWLVRGTAGLRAACCALSPFGCVCQLEACCKTTQETYQDAVAALAVVKEQLADVVTLTRPPLGLLRPGETPMPRPGARAAAA